MVDIIKLSEMQRNGMTGKQGGSPGKQDIVESHRSSADVCSLEVLELSGVLGFSSV